mmetsp:Transcript_17789/g.44023  ORF Transcript_17789/g.44023 Transcript_17789/m.44023 type:complete len:271 (+) Transcript_17789:334-1146(+)
MGSSNAMRSLKASYPMAGSTPSNSTIVRPTSVLSMNPLNRALEAPYANSGTSTPVCPCDVNPMRLGLLSTSPTLFCRSYPSYPCPPPSALALSAIACSVLRSAPETSPEAGSRPAAASSPAMSAGPCAAALVAALYAVMMRVVTASADAVSFLSSVMLRAYFPQHPTLSPPVSWSDVATMSTSGCASANASAFLNARLYAHTSARAAPASLAWPPWSMRPASTIRKNPFVPTDNTSSAACVMSSSAGGSPEPWTSASPLLAPNPPWKSIS